jgi:threonine efflux protein
MLTPLLAIAVLHWAVLLIPGFNFVLIGQLAAGGSRAAAMAAVAGMTSATLAWASLAVAGVGIVFTTHPVLRQVAQVAGGLYLLHLAWKLWRAGGTGPATAAPVLGAAAAFRAGFTTSALNPKIALFYGSVFATALPAEPSLLLVVLAVLLVFTNSVVWHSSLALLLSRPSVQGAYLRHQRALNRVSGVLVGAYGARLVAAAVAELRSRST